MTEIMARPSNEVCSFSGRKMKPLQIAQDQSEQFCKNYQSLSNLGIHLDKAHVTKMFMAANEQSLDLNKGVNSVFTAMDAGLTPLTVPSIATPIQFLQQWLPGFVYTMTAARKIDELIGMSIQGSWYDEQVVQGILERIGDTSPYGDFTNVPYANWNVNFETRTIVRFEEGMQVGVLEQQRASQMNISSSDSKRQAAANALEIQRNLIGFNGYLDGANQTFGFLNDPNLPAYIALPNGAAAASEWSTKTFLEIQSDILTAIQTLRTQSQERIDPTRDPLTLAVAMSSVDYLATTSDFGISVTAWLKEAYPNVRTKSAPQLDAADAADNVFYLYAEQVLESGSDDNRTWIQPVPTKFIMLGVDQRSKSYEESYSNATAGSLLKRPYAVIRFSGC